jgi:hypothetical protein
VGKGNVWVGHPGERRWGERRGPRGQTYAGSGQPGQSARRCPRDKHQGPLVPLTVVKKSQAKNTKLLDVIGSLKRDRAAAEARVKKSDTDRVNFHVKLLEAGREIQRLKRVEMESFFLKGELHERKLWMDKMWLPLAQQKAAFSHGYDTTVAPQNVRTGKSRRQANYSTAQKAGHLHLPGFLSSQATAAARGGAGGASAVAATAAARTTAAVAAAAAGAAAVAKQAEEAAATAATAAAAVKQAAEEAAAEAEAKRVAEAEAEAKRVAEAETASKYAAAVAEALAGAKKMVRFLAVGAAAQWADTTAAVREMQLPLDSSLDALARLDASIRADIQEKYGQLLVHFRELWMPPDTLVQVELILRDGRVLEELRAQARRKSQVREMVDTTHAAVEKQAEEVAAAAKQAEEVAAAKQAEEVAAAKQAEEVAAAKQAEEVAAAKQAEEVVAAKRAEEVAAAKQAEELAAAKQAEEVAAAAKQAEEVAAAKQAEEVAAAAAAKQAEEVAAAKQAEDVAAAKRAEEVAAAKQAEEVAAAKQAEAVAAAKQAEEVAAAKQAEEAAAAAAVAAAEQEEEEVWAELELLDDVAYEAKVGEMEREVLAAEAAAAADTATQMYSDLMGVTKEVAEAALWGVNAIPEGEREDIYIRWARSMRSVGLWEDELRRAQQKREKEREAGGEEEREEEREEAREEEREATEEDEMMMRSLGLWEDAEAEQQQQQAAHRILATLETGGWSTLTHTLLERVFRVVDMRAEGYKSMSWQHEQRQHEQDDLEHAIDGIKPGLTRKLFCTGEVGMGAAIKQLQRTVPRQKRGKKSKRWRAVTCVVQRLQQFFAVVPRRQQLGRRTKAEQKQKQKEQQQQQKQEQERQQKQEQEQEQEKEQKQKQQQKQEQKATNKGRSLSIRWGKEPTSISD